MACRTGGRSPATLVVAVVGALALTGCGAVQQPATNASSPNAALADASPATGSSVLDGVFTTRQASRGETTFRQVCQACHSISEFRGRTFRLVWAGSTVGDLFQSISTLMPKDDPGNLSPEEYSAIISYMLRENGYPAGEEDLPADASALGYIRIVAAA